MGHARQHRSHGCHNSAAAGGPFWAGWALSSHLCAGTLLSYCLQNDADTSACPSLLHALLGALGLTQHSYEGHWSA